MAASLEELLAQYRAKQAEAQAQSQGLRTTLGAGTALAGGALGLVGAIAAPIASRYLGDLFGLNERTQAEKEAIGQIRNVAMGGRTAAQSALEYQRARVGQQAAQAAAMGPARERAARQIVGQEQRIAAEGQVAGKLAEVKAAEQQRAAEALAGIESRAGEAERQRQRQMISGAITGGLGALGQAYSGYMAGKQQAAMLEAQAKGAAAAAGAVETGMTQQAATAAAPPAAPPPAAATPVAAAPVATQEPSAALPGQFGGDMLGELVPGMSSLGMTRRPSRIRTFGGSY